MKPALVSEMLDGPWQLVIASNARFGFLWHLHAEWELFVPLEGGGEALVGDWHGEFRPGEVFLVPPWLPHSFASLGRSCWQRAAVGFWHHETAAVRALSGWADLDALHRRFPGGARIGGDAAAAIAAALSVPTRPSPLAALSQLLQVLDLVLSASRVTPLASGGRGPGADPEHASSDERMNLIGRYLHRHAHERVLLSDVAAEASMSVPSLCRFFRRTTGRTIGQYLAELRIADACRRLSGTDDRILDVAQACGFPTLSHFNRSFRKARGQTPRDYRERSRRLQA